jgi:hypothetical protein
MEAVVAALRLAARQNPPLAQLTRARGGKPIMINASLVRAIDERGSSKTVTVRA